jgi:UDP-glucose 4-epimerase
MTVVLVTGGAGYVGAQAVLALLDAGDEPVVLDNLSTGSRDAVPAEAPLVVGDIGDPALLAETIRSYGVQAVMHFAASIIVPESVRDPLRYYANNTCSALGLIKACVGAGIGPFIFSSTAAVYGAPERSPIPEDAPIAPINPYGASKAMVERMLWDAAAAYPAFRPISLRYFNVAGADPRGRAGKRTDNPTHLIDLAVEAALGHRPTLQIFGRDYPTRDGTCERDYVHIADLADAHVAALRRLEDGAAPVALNCGYGRSLSVLEVISRLEQVLGRALPVKNAARRPGDPPTLVAEAQKIRDVLGWVPARDDLGEILASALAWRQTLAPRIGGA